MAGGTQHMLNKTDVWKDRQPDEPLSDYIKRKTNELYDQLPSEEEARKARLDIRDQVFELNYKFFGYVATQTFINNNYISYEDKFQSACLAFCKMWYKYRWAPKYRTDLSFAVFFKLRIGEELERELNEVKYSIRRSLCMEVGEQLGKHWGQVKYEDLSDPRLHLPPDKMNSLKAMFGSLYSADFDDQIGYVESPPIHISGIEKYESDDYDDIPSLLIRELIAQERQLTAKDFQKMSDMYGISELELEKAYPIALEQLYKSLHDSFDIRPSST